MSRGSNQGYRLADLENILSERGWSQADLARRSGLSAPTVGRATAGREEVSAGSAKRIATALRVRVGTLCRDRRESLTGAANNVADRASEHTDFDPRRMREAMSECGMNPTEIAARSELSVATVSSALRGMRKPQQNTIARIAGAFGKAPVELCSEATRASGGPSVQQHPRPSAGELRLVAGQSGTTLYPPEVDGENDASKPAQPVLTHGLSRPEIDEDGTSTDTLEGLLSRLGQARQMVGSLLEHIGNLEAQVSRAISSEAAPVYGANAGSESG